MCTWPCIPWPSSSVPQRSVQRRREFMKKLETVESSRPSCWEMVICISLEGRRFSLKMATKVRRCRSVKTSRCFFGTWLRSRPRSSSLRLHAGERRREQAEERRRTERRVFSATEIFKAPVQLQNRSSLEE